MQVPVAGQAPRHQGIKESRNQALGEIQAQKIFSKTSRRSYGVTYILGSWQLHTAKRPTGIVRCSSSD